MIHCNGLEHGLTRELNTLRRHRMSLLDEGNIPFRILVDSGPSLLNMRMIEIPDLC